MSVLALSCSQCAAPLEVPAGTKYLTCSYCNARLAVQQSGNAVYTEVLQAIQEKTERLAEDVEAIKVHHELEQLDRQWELDRQRFMISTKHGQRLPGSQAELLFRTGAVGAVGIFWMIMTFNIASRSPLPGDGIDAMSPLFGLVFIIAAIGNYFWTLSKQSEYRDALRRYQERRQEISQRLRRSGSR